MRVARTATLLLALLPSLALAQQPAAVPASDASAANNEEAATSKVPLEEIRRFVAVYNAVRAAYVDPVDDKKLMQDAVRGLLLDLDPHSTYFGKEDAEAFDEQANGAYEGIGVELQQQPDNSSLKIISPIDDTPAARAGILAGDLIIAIDGKPISAIKASEPLRGVAGSKVVLTIVRDGKPKPFDVTLARETIRVTSVRSRMLEPGYGYIRLSTFQADTGADFQKHVRQLSKQAGGQLKGLVLDLRSNPGGLLTAAVQVADDLLEKGNIVSTRGRISISDARFDATPGDLLKGAPVMVLVDAGSASASEVLAGALRDNQRARVIGSRTFGKGSVQTVLPLDNGDSVKLTTARYFTPSGKSIQATGIVPEVELKPAPVEGEEALPASLTDFSEATLPGHLHGDAEGEEGYQAGDVLPGDGPINDALAELKQPGSVAARLKAEAAKAPPKPAAEAKSEAKPEAKPDAKPTEPPVKP
ncbi:S41 family peptidase [Stenotrophomonas sp. 169]|uniref:S41 family peptidase n=1 Tax=Stenotrophomonas sp. 169 TaxID=2770322 RepID=UPI00166288AB|nr:S41 family peptidase [Stenotrophomonas sp. 169]QNR97651.1 S41 family peptidase [Stenotrophomonas sp. 169]